MSIDQKFAFLGVVAQEEREAHNLRREPQLYRAVRELLIRRRDRRREQAEASAGEAAAVMRGRCQELTALINEVFPDYKEA